MDFPDYEVPDGVEGAQPVGDTTVVPPADPPVDAAADAGAGDPIDAGAAGDAGESVPKHRLDEIIAQRRQQDERIAELLRTSEASNAELARLRTAAAAAFGVEVPGADKAVDPKIAAARARLLELVPEFKDVLDLVAQKDSLLGVAGQLPHIKSSTENYWNRVADLTTAKVFDTLAATMLGEGKTGADLTAKQRQHVHQDFVRWIEEDTTGQREARYEALDAKLVDEFRDDIDATYLATIRRSQNAATLAAGRRTAGLPVAGSSSAPVVTGNPNKKPETDDEAADLAALNFRAQMAAQ